MGRRKFRLGTGRKNAERKRQELKQKRPGRPNKNGGKAGDDIVMDSNTNKVVFNS